MTLAESPTDKAVRTRTRPFARYHRSIAFITIGSVIATLFEALTLVLIVPLAQKLTTRSEEIPAIIPVMKLSAGVGALVALAAISIIVALAIRLVTVLHQTHCVAEWERDMRNELTNAYLAAEWPLQNAERASSLAQYAAFANFAAGRLNQLVNTLRASTSLAVLVTGAIVVDARAAVVMMVAGCLLFLGFRPLVRASRRAAATYALRSIDMANGLEELVTFSKERRVYGIEAHAREQMISQTTAFTDAMEKNQRLGGLVTPVYQAIGLLLVCAALAVANSTSSVDMTALGTSAILLLRGLTYGQQLQNAFQKFAEAAPFTAWLDTALANYRAQARTHGEVAIDGIDRVELRSLSYNYDDAAEGEASNDALSDITLTMHAGETIGIAGPSGAGKSTLAQILLRLRRPTRGTYCINGIDANDLSEESFAAHVAFVPQETRLLLGTVHDNIALFRPGLTRRDVERAATRAGIADAIAALPHGYDTMVGPTSRELSGGQTQRIGIARALAGSPAMIVLDEPTSALDADSEAIVHDSLVDLANGIIIVVIAHRPSTLAVCSRIVVIEHGHLVTDAASNAAELDNAFFARMMESGARR